MKRDCGLGPGWCAAGEIGPGPEYMSKVETRFTDKFCVDDEKKRGDESDLQEITYSYHTCKSSRGLKRCRFPRSYSELLNKHIQE